MRWLSLAMAVVFGVAGLKALFAFDAATSPISRPVLLAICAACTALFAFLYIRATRTRRELSAFEAWLEANQALILRKGASYNGVDVTGDTELVRFTLAASVIVLSFKIPSRHYLAGRDNVQLTRLAYSLASFLFGWWGIPWGPVYTVQALASNLSGGVKMTVRDYFAEAA